MNFDRLSKQSDITHAAIDSVLSALRQLRAGPNGARLDALYFWLTGDGRLWLTNTIHAAIEAELGEEARAPKPARPAAKPYQTPTMIRADKVPGVSEQLAAAGGLPAEARAAVALLMPFADQNDVRWGINGVHIVDAEPMPLSNIGINGPFYGVSTDGHRLTFVGFDCGAQNAALREMLRERRRMLYRITDEDEIDLIEGEFPDFLAVLPDDKPAREFSIDFDIRKRFNDFRAYVASATPPDVLEEAQRKERIAESLAPILKTAKDRLKLTRRLYRAEKQRLGKDPEPFTYGLTSTGQPAGRAKTLGAAKEAAAKLAQRKRLSWPTHRKGTEAAADFQVTDGEDITVIFRSDRTQAALAYEAGLIERLIAEVAGVQMQYDEAKNAADDGTVLPKWDGTRPMFCAATGVYFMNAPVSKWLQGASARFEFGRGTALSDGKPSGIAPRYFHAALEFVAPDTVRSGHPLSPIMFQGKHNRVAVVMPMRID